MSVKYDEIKQLLTDLITLRDKCRKSKSKKLHARYEVLQQECAKRLDFLVESRTRRYKSFSNYDDLCQDGRLALFLALQSYDPEKGDFFWWANKYIKTKISREANRHSAMKIPIKEAQTVQPYKVTGMPVIVDSSPNALENISTKQQTSMIRKALEVLPDTQRDIIERHFEIGATHSDASIGKICKALNITRSNCLKLLTEAKKTLKNELINLQQL